MIDEYLHEIQFEEIRQIDCETWSTESRQKRKTDERDIHCVED